MRIIAGQWRGVPLATVGKGDPGAHLRPTPDRVRESLFSMLTHRGVIEGAHVLDLFAGTGALGLEALSRGAARAVFVENGRVGQKLIAENIKKLRAEDRTKLLRSDATRAFAWDGPKFDLVFLDPPYGKGMGDKALTSIRDHCADDALIVWEENAPQSPPDGYALLDQRRFGSTHVTLLEPV
ncbi:16S rRNA (guanine(966)-N(2))-methyltransferase RsmD [Tateyamaria omphalii]|uniref:16S rRNA (guanine(966)-N(2))-methyltransferase RsmD n=1 Tax=Tateyamaria omphalii TaxID=299262 RepID=UPI001C99A949|nr:16S rRNA (guanine(966)-N(2))-methyltransferase RsmD [Tateyamaria omphalii]MBY5935396.1 16S rRNA (guanine(966)-N(2))-methyltransferase RsmD [Tateyamaria omphalii]